MILSPENKVNSHVFGLLTQSVFYQMFPNKVGIARLLMILRDVSILVGLMYFLNWQISQLVKVFGGYHTCLSIFTCSEMG